VRLEALLVVVMVCVFVEKPWGNFDRNSFGLVFKAVLSGAKFNVHHPSPKAASGCGSTPGSFSTPQMTQIAKIVL